MDGFGMVDVRSLIEEVRKQMSAMPERQWYSPAEVAKKLDRTAYTVRQWCNLGRINAEKRSTGRGSHKAWKISSKEITRIQDEGLLPDPRFNK